jgi:hypothetical protein
MKIKTSEASGAVLDWLVELALGTHWSANGYFIHRYAGCGPNGHFDKNSQWRYSTEWAAAGPIIEREFIEISPAPGNSEWVARIHGPHEKYQYAWVIKHQAYGPTPLIAAMRCFCASKLGDEVEVPDELAA